MTARDVPEDGQPNVPPIVVHVRRTGVSPDGCRLPIEAPGICYERVPPCRAQETASVRGARLTFPGGHVDTSRFVASHNGPTKTTLRNVKRTRPAETYPGESKKMVDRWTTLTLVAVQRARDATSGPRLVSELEEAEHAIQEALRWSKP